MKQKHLFENRARLTVVAIGVLAALVVAAVPIGATVIDRGHYSDTDSFSYDDCGFLVEVSVEFSGVYRIREGKKKNSSAFFLMDNFSYKETHTNPETGEWLVIRGNGVFNETKAQRVEGTIFKFSSVLAGQPFVVEDSSGDVVLRDRGVIRQTILFDTEGDDEPGGTEIELLEEVIKGPHPGFFADYCEVITDLIGPSAD
jgi:hypothetical protein